MFRRSGKKRKANAYVIEESRATEKGSADLRILAQSRRKKKATRAKNRIWMCAVAFVFVYLLLGARLAFVSFGEFGSSERFAGASSSDAPRPEIIDRTGALLATDLPVVALEVVGHEVWDPNDTANALAHVIPEIDAGALAVKLQNGRYVEVRSDLTPAERKAIFDLGLPGVRFTTRTKRFYPQSDLAAHVVGHGEAGKGGVMGLERVVDARSKGPVQASIDVSVQQVLEDELASSREKFQAKAAWGAVIDVATGEVIALASLPDFDPNAPGAAPADSRRNRAVYDRYELGSAFKSFTAAAVLDAGLAKENTKYDARGDYKIADRRITDFHGENRVLTLSEVIQYSSNIGIARAAADLGPARQKAYLKKLGLFEPLSIEFVEKRAPQLPRQWGPVEAATVAYGHGISVTPLHLLSAFAAVVNGGVFNQPTFLALQGDVKRRRVFSNNTSVVMRRILRRVITDGTAEQAEAAGYFPIGKTATADKPAFGGYNRNTRIASFVGAFPGYAPEYAVLVSLDEPLPLPETFGFATAGWNAAPTFARIVERSAPLLGVSPVNEAIALAAFVSGEFEQTREARVSYNSLERTK